MSTNIIINNNYEKIQTHCTNSTQESKQSINYVRCRSGLRFTKLTNKIQNTFDNIINN